MTVKTKKLQRNFILGDSWLYYKIYTGSKTSDIVLTDIIKPVVKQLMTDKIIDKWFFIRYGDPKHHLRVRFHYEKPKHIEVIVNCLFPFFKDFIDKDFIWKIQIDTYKREIERYGSKTMILSEQIFYHDSTLIVDFINLIEGDEGEELRWLFSLRAVDSLLDSFKYDEKEKLYLLDRLKTSFGNEFGMSRLLKKQLDDRFRIERKKIENFITFKASGNPDYIPILDILKIKEKAITPLVSEILKLKKDEILKKELNDLMSSYIHMLMNRLFKSKNRLHEMVCYDFLYRYYKSMIARKKHFFKGL